MSWPARAPLMSCVLAPFGTKTQTAGAMARVRLTRSERCPLRNRPQVIHSSEGTPSTMKAAFASSGASTNSATDRIALGATPAVAANRCTGDRPRNPVEASTRTVLAPKLSEIRRDKASRRPSGDGEGNRSPSTPWSPTRTADAARWMNLEGPGRSHQSISRQSSIMPPAWAKRASKRLP
jgi:hypothetical protein